MDNQYFFSVPATFGMQGPNQVIFLTPSMGTLDRLLTSDIGDHTLDRSQRGLNKKRAKAITQYLVKSHKEGKPFVLPPLIGNCDVDLDFEQIGNSNITIIKFPMDAKIKLFDGQHRAQGIIDFVNDCPDARHYSIPIMIMVNLPLQVRQQFFSDINNNASKPSASINMAYDGNNVLAQTVKTVIMEDDILRSCVDFDNNIVKAKSNFWFSYKAICDASTKIISALPEDSTAEMHKEVLASVWSAWSSFVGLRSTVRATESALYRQDWVTFSGVMINAFGWAAREIIAEGGTADLIRKIDALSLNCTERNRDNFFLTENWVGVCVDPDRLTLKADVRSQKAAADKMVLALINCTFK